MSKPWYKAILLEMVVVLGSLACLARKLHLNPCEGQLEEYGEAILLQLLLLPGDQGNQLEVRL